MCTQNLRTLKDDTGITILQQILSKQPDIMFLTESQSQTLQTENEKSYVQLCYNLAVQNSFIQLLTHVLRCLQQSKVTMSEILNLIFLSDSPDFNQSQENVNYTEEEKIKPEYSVWKRQVMSPFFFFTQCGDGMENRE